MVKSENPTKMLAVLPQSRVCLVLLFVEAESNTKTKTIYEKHFHEK